MEDKQIDIREQDSLGSLVSVLNEYLFIIRRNWYLIIPTFLLVVTLGVIYTIRQPKIYQAVATIILKIEAVRPLGRHVEAIDQQNYNYYLYRHNTTEYRANLLY